MNRRIFFISFVLLITVAGNAHAVSVGSRASFFVDDEYDLAGRSELEAQLVKNTPKLALYIDKNWWDSRNEARKSEIRNKLQQLSEEFERKIYPDLT